ncbi:MAG: hypothetical protein GYB26_12725 [Gammaproteobacteria bacterium]|uniref:helix-hairpin-helix domain-containing protein n=1 Tax=Marinobacter sp. TaxID=50741 RepID=UPI003A95A210|nr:hypothetical protein [Gammaproteobacteria bacterium]
MAKKSKPSIDAIVKSVNKEFDKASGQIESLINDALKQLDQLQTHVQEPVRKLLKEVEELKEREIGRFNDELERRMNDFHELQTSLLDKLGLASKEVETDVKKAAKSTVKKAKSVTKQAKPNAKKPAAKKAPAKKPAAVKKPAAKKAAKPVDKSDLTLVKGIGPATAKKMKEAGITSIEQIANPSDADKKKLENFKSVKGFDSLSSEAKKVL